MISPCMRSCTARCSGVPSHDRVPVSHRPTGFRQSGDGAARSRYRRRRCRRTQRPPVTSRTAAVSRTRPRAAAPGGRDDARRRGRAPAEHGTGGPVGCRPGRAADSGHDGGEHDDRSARGRRDARPGRRPCGGRGVADVDDSGLARALYSSDASLYRVLPRAVVRPRHADEIVADARGLPLPRRPADRARARAPRSPATPSAPGSSWTPAGTCPGCSTSTPRRGRRPSSRASSRRPCRRRREPHGLRFGPDPSTHNRCTVGGMIGNNACGSRALGYGRTSDNVVGLDVVTGSGARLRPAAGRPPARRRPRRPARGWSAGELGDDPHRARPLRPAGVGLLAGAPAARARLRRGPGAGRQRGHAGAGARRHGAAGRRRPVPRPGRARLPDDGRRRRRHARRCSRTPRPPSRGWTPGSCSGCATCPPPSSPTCPRGEGWLIVELTGDSVAEVAAKARRRARRRRRAGLAGRHRRRPRPRRIWRIREDGAGLAARTSDGRPAHAGWEDAAVPPERLGAYLRDFEALLDEHGLQGVPVRALRRRLRARAHRLPVRVGAGPGPRRATGPSSRTPPGWSPATAARCPASTATAGPAASCCRSCTPPPSSACSSGSRRCSTRTTCSTPASSCARPGSTTTSGWPPRPVVREGLALAYRHDGGDFSAAVHRCTGVGKCRADLPPPAASCARPGRPPGRRRTPPAAGPGCCRRCSRPAARSATGARPRCTTPSTCACPARAAPATARPASTWRPTRPRCCTSPTGAGCARASHYTLGRLPLLGRPRRPRAPAGQRGARLAARRAAGQVVGGHGPAPRGAAVRAAHLPAGVGRPPGAGRRTARRWRCGWTRSPTTSPRRWRSPPRGCSRRPATACRCPAPTPAAG